MTEEKIAAANKVREVIKELNEAILAATKLNIKVTVLEDNTSALCIGNPKIKKFVTKMEVDI